MRITLWRALLLVLFLLGTQAFANPMDFAEDTALYFDLSTASAFLPNTTTNPDVQIAEINFSIKYTRVGNDTTFEGISAQFTFDTTHLEYVSAESTPMWSGGDFSCDTSGNLVFLEFLGGAVDLDDITSYQAFAKVRFKLRCLDVNYPLTWPLSFTSSITLNSVDLEDLGNIYPPTTGGHRDNGSVRYTAYQVRFSAVADTRSNSWSNSFPVTVNATTNAKSSSFTNTFYLDDSKYVLDSVVFADNWGSTSATLSQADVLTISATGGNVIEKTASTLYVVWLTRTCEPAVGEQLNFSFSSKGWGIYACQPYSYTNMHDNAVIGFLDSAAVEAYSPDGQPFVWKDASTAIRYKVKLKHTVDAGLRQDKGIDFAVSWKKSGEESIDGALRLDSCPSLTSGNTWQPHTIGSEDTVGVIHYTGTQIVPATETMTDRLWFYFTWLPANFSRQKWDSAYVAPFFADAFHTYEYTEMPINACPGKSLREEYKYSDFNDTIRVAMAQPGTNSVSTTNSCLSQNVRIRSNFGISRCSMYVACPTAGQITGWGSVRSGLTVTRIDEHMIRIGGQLTDTIAASATFTNLLTVYTAIDNCIPSQQFVSLDIGTVRVFSTQHEAFAAAQDKGVASITCMQLCPQDFMEQEDDSLARVGVPSSFALSQNFPNPFNPTTTIALTLPRFSNWKITIYNLTGQALKEFSGESSQGTVEVTWDASNYASGVYFYRAEASEFRETRKMLLLK